MGVVSYEVEFAIAGRGGGCWDKKDGVQKNS
jgi:hypothetical protein